MLIIPAIDLKDGRCVRLRQGRMDDDTVFADDPTAVARRWVDEGARRLHLVDLDGAFAGEPRNGDVVRAIVAGAGDVPVQIGGGIRSEAIADAYIEAGVRWLIVGTLAVTDPAFVDALCARHPGRVIVGLDAKDGLVATEGWAETSSVRATELARRFEGKGVAAIVYTDIARDGMMQGVNVEATAALADAVGIPVIASGGVATLDDIRALGAVSDARGGEGVRAGTGTPIFGAIVGRALYEGTVEIGAAQALGDSFATSGAGGDASPDTVGASGAGKSGTPGRGV